MTYPPDSIDQTDRPDDAPPLCLYGDNTCTTEATASSGYSYCNYHGAEVTQ